jgi:hypothetical protein
VFIDSLIIGFELTRTPKDYEKDAPDLSEAEATK